MVRGLKAKDLFKDDKVTLSTKWREKSLGNNPFECWRLGGTWPWLGGRIMAINAAGTISNLVSFVFQHKLVKTAFNSCKKEGWATFFRNVIYEREDRTRSDIAIWKLRGNFEMSFVRSGNGTKISLQIGNLEKTCKFWHLCFKWGYLLSTFR